MSSACQGGPRKKLWLCLLVTVFHPNPTLKSRCFRKPDNWPTHPPLVIGQAGKSRQTQVRPGSKDLRHTCRGRSAGRDWSCFSNLFWFFKGMARMLSWIIFEVLHFLFYVNSSSYSNESGVARIHWFWLFSQPLEMSNAITLLNTLVLDICISEFGFITRGYHILCQVQIGLLVLDYASST